MLINTARLVPNLAKQRREPLTKHDALTVLISRLKWKEHEFCPTEHSKPNTGEHNYLKEFQLFPNYVPSSTLYTLNLSGSTGYCNICFQNLFCHLCYAQTLKSSI